MRRGKSKEEKSKLDVKFIFKVICNFKINFLLLPVQGVLIPVTFLTGLEVKAQLL